MGGGKKMLDNESICGVSSNAVMKSSLDSGKLANGKVKMGDVRSTFFMEEFFTGLPVNLDPLWRKVGPLDHADNR